MREGLCVSEGVIEFSSSYYHVQSDAEFVVIEIVRSFDTVDLDWVLRGSAHKPVVVVQTVDSRSAHSVSGAQQRLTDFETTMETLEFDVTFDAFTDSLSENAFTLLLNSTNSTSDLITSSGVPYSGVSWRGEAMRTISLKHSVQIPVFDNGVYDAEEKFFTVRLVVDSETTAGSVMPMTPFTPYFERSDISAVPGSLVQHAQLDEARVYIWDRSDTASASDTFLKSDSPIATGEIFRTGPQVGTVIDVEFIAQKCLVEAADGCSQLGPVDSANDVARFLVITEPTMKGSSDRMLGDALYTRKALASNGIYKSYSMPFIAGPFRIHIQQSFAGLNAMYYSWSPEPAAYQRPDILRIDHGLTHDWRSGRDSPRYVRWTGFLHWDCLRDRFDRLGSAVPSLLGVAVSAQSWVRIAWKNIGIVLEEYRAGYSWMTDDEWNRPNISVVQSKGCTPAVAGDGIYCFAIAGGEVSSIESFGLSYQSICRR